MRRMLFLHGAGGYEEDRPLAEGLAAATGGAALIYPSLPEPPFAPDDMSYSAWSTTIDRHLDAIAPSDLLVAHSFGASILLQVLYGRGNPPAAATLLAMPDWSADGWDVADYSYASPANTDPANTGLAPSTVLRLVHCRDDDVVDYGHLALHAARLPAAHVHSFPTGGHQFDGRIPQVTALISP